MPPYGGLPHRVSVSDSAPVDVMPRNVNACTDALYGMKRAVVLVLGPHREAVSGVSTHLNTLFASRLADDFSLIHFQVGSEGRRENFLQKVARLAAGHVKMVLSGDGGDEAFAGYSRYQKYMQLNRMARLSLGTARHGLALAGALAGNALGTRLRRIADRMALPYPDR